MKKWVQLILNPQDSSLGWNLMSLQKQKYLSTEQPDHSANCKRKAHKLLKCYPINAVDPDINKQGVHTMGTAFPLKSTSKELPEDQESDCCSLILHLKVVRFRKYCHPKPSFTTPYSPVQSADTALVAEAGLCWKSPS